MLHNALTDFRDSCGFALLAHMDGEKSHWLMETTLESLARLTHRGAVAADGKSGDGCGILLQFPEPFLREVADECGFKLGERFASGLVFFSPDPALIERGQKILARRLGRAALDVVGWREVPTCPEVVGEQAKASMPAIYQVFVNAPPGWRAHDIERQLFAARRLAFEEEKQLDDPDPLYYVVTLSNLTMVYKGLVQAEHLGDFFPDLRDERMTSDRHLSSTVFDQHPAALELRTTVPLPGTQRGDQQRQRQPRLGQRAFGHPALAAAAEPGRPLAPGEQRRLGFLLAGQSA